LQRGLEEGVVTAPPEDTVYLIDAYHGGVTFWDWVVAPGGGLWYFYFWPQIGEPLIDAACRRPDRPVVFEFDAHAYEDMARRAPAAIAKMRWALACGALEVVNGTYAQPLSQTISGECNLRHFFYGLRAIRRALGVDVRYYLSQEPLFFPQLPQILKGFGYEGAVLRTHWSPFGTDPARDAALVRWRGPDGSEIPTAPRYTFMDYPILGDEHAGATTGGLVGGDLHLWDGAQLRAFAAEARARGIRAPLLARVADIKPPESPLPNLEEMEKHGLRAVTHRQYFRLAQGDAPPVVSFGPADIPASIPWGLGGDRLQQAGTAAEGALLAAERLDAVARVAGGQSTGARRRLRRLDSAWKRLLLSQHHDLHVCGPSLSKRHNSSTAEAGRRMAVAAERSARRVAQEALADLASRVGTSRLAGQAFVVFNPSPWPRREYLEVPLAGAQQRLRLAVRDGERVPSQVVARSPGRATYGLVVDLPPLGYTVLEAVAGEGEDETAGRRTDSPAAFENGFYRSEMDQSGYLRLASTDGRRLVDSAGYLTVWRDGAWHDSREGKPRVRLLDDGPVFQRFEMRDELAGIPFRERVTLYRDLPRIDFRADFDFGDGTLLGPQLEDHRPDEAYFVQDEKKLCVNVEAPFREVLYESPYLLDRSHGGRVIGLGFVGLEDASGRGVALLNRGTRGHHFDARRGVLRQVLAWAPAHWLYAGEDFLEPTQTRFTYLTGRVSYEFALYPYHSEWEAERASWDYLLPVLWAPVKPSRGRLPLSASFLDVGPEPMLLTALFASAQRTGRQGEDVYARLWNASNRQRRAVLRSGGRVRVLPCDFDLSPANEDGEGGGALSLRPWGIQTVRVKGLKAGI
jgi:alpha-mannosidase